MFSIALGWKHTCIEMLPMAWRACDLYRRDIFGVEKSKCREVVTKGGRAEEWWSQEKWLRLWFPVHCFLPHPLQYSFCCFYTRRRICGKGGRKQKLSSSRGIIDFALKLSMRHWLTIRDASSRMFPQHAMPQQSVLAVMLSRPLRAVWKSNKLKVRKHTFILWQARKICVTGMQLFCM